MMKLLSHLPVCVCAASVEIIKTRIRYSALDWIHMLMHRKSEETLSSLTAMYFTNFDIEPVTLDNPIQLTFT